MRRTKRIPQREFSFTAAAFNLISERGQDPLRAILDKARADEAREKALEFERKMQRVLSECPGFVGCDAPASPSCPGKVMVEPGRISEAMPWLKRRFLVNENLELSVDSGLCVEVAPRRVAGRKSRGRSPFTKLEQFELGLAIEE